MMEKRGLRLTLVFTLLIGLVAFGYVYFVPDLSKELSKPAISGYQTPFMIGDYEMEDHHGNKASWSSLSERPIYLTAGFTRCPHSCPMTMVIYQKLAKKIGPQADYALLTVDPEYDKTPILSAYLSAINPDFIGLRIGDKAELDLAMADLKQTLVDTGEPLDLMHGDYIYLMHPKLTGLVIYTKPDAAVMAQDLEILNAI
jgi:cytochrome oxidase Cu insertion factor (SCO1/SenC/PrrC family)